MSKSNIIDLTGQKFNMLTVIEYMGKSRDGRRKWLCQCDCGNTKVIEERKFLATKGKITKSCGCLRLVAVKEKTSKNNIYFEENGYMVGLTTKGERFLFDKEDYDKIKGYCWSVEVRGYMVANARQGRNVPKIKMHQLIMPKTDLVIDHINHNKFDNRKENLRICTQQQNCMNTIKPKHNTSGYIGVSWSKIKKAWVAQIRVNYKTIILGYYEVIEEAVNARREGEFKYFGEFKGGVHNGI